MFWLIPYQIGRLAFRFTRRHRTGVAYFGAFGVVLFATPFLLGRGDPVMQVGAALIVAMVLIVIQRHDE